MRSRNKIEHGDSTDLSGEVLPSRQLVDSFKSSQVDTDYLETTLGDMGDYLVRLGEYIGNNLYEANRRLYAGQEYTYAGKPYEFPENIKSEDDPAWQHWKTKAGSYLGYTNEYQSVEEIQKQFKRYGEFLKLVEDHKEFKDLIFGGLEKSPNNFKYVEGVIKDGEIQNLSADFEQIGSTLLNIYDRLTEVKEQTIEKHRDSIADREMRELKMGYDNRFPYNAELKGYTPYSVPFLRQLHRLGRFLESEKYSSLNSPTQIPYEPYEPEPYNPYDCVKAPYCGKPISGTFDDVVPIFLPKTKG